MYNIKYNKDDKIFKKNTRTHTYWNWTVIKMNQRTSHDNYNWLKQDNEQQTALKINRLLQYQITRQ